MILNDNYHLTPIENIFANADQILVMKNGTIVESGNHQELLDRKEKYFELWNKQSLA